jgi:HlyD family secretion protein
MDKKSFRRILIGVVVVGLVGFLFYAFQPAVVPVDQGKVMRGPMVVTIDEEARTRVREVYAVSAPVTGRLLRIEAEAGDAVAADETIIATILPSDPSILDVRTRSQAEADVRAAQAALTLSQAEVGRAKAQLDFARGELARARELRRRGTNSEVALDKANLDVRAAEAAFRTAQATVKVREAQLENARALLTGPREGAGGSASRVGVMVVRAPVSGRVLQLMQESETVVLAGTPLVEIGDPRNDLEVEVELLSTEVIQVEPGQRVIIHDWGGVSELRGEVERVEPFGFTKISALGVEEQRVRVIVQFLDAPDQRESLGHGFRVETRIVTWEEADVLRVPTSALFRKGESWAVFRVRNGVVRLVLIEIGRNNAEMAEVISGLDVDDSVVLYPSDRISDGISVTSRAR